MSLSDYLLAEVRQISERPTLAELRERLLRREPVALRKRPRAPSGLNETRGDRAGRVGRDQWMLRTKRKRSTRDSSGPPRRSPHLLDIEVAQVLRRFVAGGKVTPVRAREALDDLLDLALTRYPHGVLLGRVWELRSNLTAYDAAYVALAEALDAVLVTCDGKIAEAPGHRARIEVFQ